MYKNTIEKPIEIVGIGLHSGVPVTMRMLPASVNNGISFVRTDQNLKIPVNIKNVVGTTLATIVGKNGFCISTIEHVLSSLMAFGIDNLTLEIDNEEVPTLDGSAAGFCMMLQDARLKPQEEKKQILVVKKTIEVRDDDKFVRLEPYNKTIFDYTIDFKHPAIKKQQLSFEFTTANYIKEIARARTFGFLHELSYLKSIGKGKGADLNNVIAMDEKRVLNPEGLRFKDEFVRHKILDAIGDMSFLGMAFLGRYSSFAGSHRLNHLLTKEILSNKDYYEIVEAK